MIERTIVLPVHDNNGDSLDSQLDNIRLAILVLSGGYSEVTQVGRWIDDSGKVYFNESIRISTTVTEQTDKAIIERIPVWCTQLRQLAIYTHSTQVSAMFVEPLKQETSIS